MFAILFSEHGITLVAAGNYSQLVKAILVISAYLLPFILIPFMIKSMSGAFGNLAGMVNDRGKGLLDRQKNYRGNKRKEKRADAIAGNRFKGNNALYNRLNRATGYASNIQHAGINPMRMRSNMRAHLGDHHYEHAMEQSEKLPGAKAFFANDDLMMAGLRGEGSTAKTRDYLRAQGYQGPALESAVSQVMKMRSEMGAEGYALAALSKLPATGTAYEEGNIGQWHNDIAKYTHGNKSLQGTIVAAGKAGFRASQRYEVSEAGFGDHMEAIKMAESGASTSSITEHVVDKAYASGGAQAVVASRNAKTAGMFAGAINRDIARGREASTQTGDATHLVRALSAASAVHDQVGQAKRIVSDTLSSQVFAAGSGVGSDDGTRELTVVQAFDQAKKDAPEVWMQGKKEYLSEMAAAAGGRPPENPGGGTGIPVNPAGGGFS